MKRTLVPAAALLAVAMFVLTGCPKKGGADGDGGADGAVAVIDAGAPVKIANEADIKRYASDETAADGDATVLAPAAVRTAAPGGAIVTTLKQGTVVTQLAEHGGFVLVTFDDPKDATRKLEGWVGKSVFTAPHAVTHLSDGGAMMGDAGAGAKDAGAAAPAPTGMAKADAGVVPSGPVLPPRFGDAGH